MSRHSRRTVRVIPVVDRSNKPTSLIESLEARKMLSVSTTAPTATFSGMEVTYAGANKYDFAVIYTDSVAVDPSTISGSNLTVTGPNGFSQEPTLVSVDQTSPSAFVTAIYQLSPPNGTFDTTTTGTYTVSVNASQVKDTSNLSVAAGVLSTITVDITPTSLVNNVLYVSGTPGADTVTLSESSGEVSADVNGTTTMFDAVDVTYVQIATGAGNDSVTDSTSLAVTLLGGLGADTLVAGSGKDLIKGQRNPDSLIAGSGADTIDGGRGPDTIVGGSGGDFLAGDRGADNITAGSGGDTITTNLGLDTVFAHNGVADLIYGAGDTAGQTAHIDLGLDTVTGIETVLDT